MSTTAQRIKEGLEIRGLKQSDLVEKTGISKGALSSYISGRYMPKQNNIYLISKALNVNEAWLMGADVPMERGEYEDPSLLKRDAMLEDIEQILSHKGWTLFCDTYDDDYFTVKNANGQAIANFYDYELIARYKTLKKKGKITADLLVSSKSIFYKYMESLGYYVGKDDPEHKPFVHYENGTVIISDNILNDIRTRIDTYAKATMDTVILKLNEEEIHKKRKEKERFAEHLLANAAHARTDIEIPEGADISESDIMDDEDF